MGLASFQDLFGFGRWRTAMRTRVLGFSVFDFGFGVQGRCTVGCRAECFKGVELVTANESRETHGRTGVAVEIALIDSSKLSRPRTDSCFPEACTTYQHNRHNN